MDIFTAIYFAALVIEMIIRAPLNKQRKQEKMSERRVTNQEIFILVLLIVALVLSRVSVPADPKAAGAWLTKIRDLAAAYSSIEACRSRWSGEKFRSTAIHGLKVSTDSS